MHPSELTRNAAHCLHPSKKKKKLKCDFDLFQCQKNKNASSLLQFSLFINVLRVSSALPEMQYKFATERYDDARLSDIKFFHVRSSSAPTAR